MAQVTVKKEFVRKEIVKNCVGVEVISLEELQENQIGMKIQNMSSKDQNQNDLQKINKILLKIAKKSKNNDKALNSIIPFKALKQKLVYRNYNAY